MIMVDQSKRLSRPLGWTKAGRLATILVGGALLAIVVAVVVIASTRDSSPPPGCIEVTFASTLGAAVEHPCGARAREVCAHPEQNPGLTEHGALHAACRKAGLPYGRPASG